MKVFISVDMEGTSGLERLEEIFRGLPGFDRFRRLMAGDANAVVQGAIEGGADEIVVSDSHGYMCNINPDDLVPGVRLKRGQLRRRWCQMKGFESDFDAVLLVGFHAKAGNADAILSHTWITSFLDVRVNGQSVPEPSLNTWLAGAFGVPVVMLSGDDQVIAEASPVMGDVHYAQLKKSTGYFSGEHLPLDESRRLLRETARDAVRDARHFTPVQAELPVTIELDLSPDAVEATPLGARVGRQPALRRPRLGRRAAQRRRPRARDASRGHARRSRARSPSPATTSRRRTRRSTRSSARSTSATSRTSSTSSPSRTPTRGRTSTTSSASHPVTELDTDAVRPA